MEEEMQFIVDAAKESMESAIQHLEKEMLNIRAGKANPIMLSGVKVDYYGSLPPYLKWPISIHQMGEHLPFNPGKKVCLQILKRLF